MGNRDDSLRGRDERVTPRKSSRGNYPYSAFLAQFWWWNNGIWEEDTFGQDEEVSMLLFMQDCPHKWAIDSFYLQQTLPFPCQEKDYQELGFYLKGNLAGLGILTPDDVTPDLYQQTTGVTVTHGVRTSGYFLNGTVLDRTISHGGQPCDCKLTIDARSSAPVRWGPVHHLVGDGYLYLPALIDEQFYTQAVADGGEVYYNGAVDTYLTVVGIYRHIVRA